MWIADVNVQLFVGHQLPAQQLSYSTFMNFLLAFAVHLYFLFGMKDKWWRSCFSPTLVLACDLYHSRAHTYKCARYYLQYVCNMTSYVRGCKCFSFVLTACALEAVLFWHERPLGLCSKVEFGHCSWQRWEFLVLYIAKTSYLLYIYIQELVLFKQTCVVLYFSYLCLASDKCSSTMYCTHESCKRKDFQC